MKTAGISVLDFAVQAERDGAAFYAQAAEKAQDENLKGFLQSLARDEKKHEEHFLALKERIAKAGQGDYFASAEVDDYLDAVIRGGLFEAASALPGADYEPELIGDFYRIAIRAERSSILLYQALLDAAKEKGLKRALAAMLREEKSHLTRIVAHRADRDNLFAIERFGCMC
jgi:rubrerythrin